MSKVIEYNGAAGDYVFKREGNMAKKKKTRNGALAPKPPDSFTLAELRKALKKVKAARGPRQQELVAHGAR
jgi:hypothetical protein